jgi:Protein of unknown function (DUF2934)
MAEVSDPIYDKPHEDPAHRELRIHELAHKLWEQAGCPEGKSDLFWYRAEELIEDENQSAYPPAQSRGHRD